jgi:hypothetical protein
MVDLELDSLITKLKRERPIRTSRILKFPVRFPQHPLTEAEMANAEWVKSWQGTPVTTYQYRALALLDEDFYIYLCKKYRPEIQCVWTIDEFKPLFNEIHRAIAYLVEQGYTVEKALKEYFKPASMKARKDRDDEPATE